MWLVSDRKHIVRYNDRRPELGFLLQNKVSARHRELQLLSAQGYAEDCSIIVRQFQLPPNNRKAQPSVFRPPSLCDLASAFRSATRPGPLSAELFLGSIGVRGIFCRKRLRGIMKTRSRGPVDAAARHFLPSGQHPVWRRETCLAAQQLPALSLPAAFLIAEPGDEEP